MKSSNFIIVTICLITFCVFGYLLKSELQDVVRDILTRDNISKGVLPVDSVKWCTLPISHHLDEGGVPEGLMDITHPSICYIPDGKFSHRWWMAATPYPQSLKVGGEPYENTCIFYADNTKEYTPLEFSSISKNHIIYKSGARYNSDPDLFFDECDSTLFVFTRKRWGKDYKSNIVMQTSKNGENWSEPLSVVKTISQSLCPCIVKCGSFYRIYLYEYETEKQNPTSSIEIWESPSLLSPQFKHVKSIPWTLPSYIWHGDVIRYGKKYYMIYCGANKDYKTRIGTTDEAKYLWVAESEDGYTFKDYKRPLLKMNGVYRSSFTIIDDIIYCYFSVSNRYRTHKYPSGNRIGVITYPVDELHNLL